jgi:hypothetical protein
MKSYFVLSLYCEFEKRNRSLELPKQFNSKQAAIKYAKKTGTPITQFRLSGYLTDSEEMIETKNLEEWELKK